MCLINLVELGFNVGFIYLSLFGEFRTFSTSIKSRGRVSSLTKLRPRIGVEKTDVGHTQ